MREPRDRRARTVALNGALVVFSVASTLLVVEIALRVASEDVGVTTLRNFAEQRLSLFQSAYPAQYDRELGWIPRPGYSGRDNVWKTRVTISDDGLRSNGRPAPPGTPILMVGDSFAFGDEVSDQETIASHLEARTGRPVLNGGVFGYGVDQTVMRAERLLTKHRPDVLVLQLVRDDIYRTKLSVRTGVEKPYFELEGGALALRNVPADPRRPSISDVGVVRKVFGYSYLVDWTMRHTGRGEWWYLGQWPHTWVHDDTELSVNISCKLVARLAARMQRDGVRGILVALYGLPVLSWPADHPDLGAIQQLLACARPTWQVIDTFGAFKALGAGDPSALRGRYAQVHLSADGARHVADLIERQISSRTSSSAAVEQK